MSFQELSEVTSHSVAGFSKGLIARSQFIASKDSFCGWHPTLETEGLANADCGDSHSPGNRKVLWQAKGTGSSFTKSLPRKLEV